MSDTGHTDVADWAGPAHGLLSGRSVLVTAAAGTGIGFATARRAAEEGAQCRRQRPP